MTPPLTDKQDKYLSDLYYKKKQFFGRDRLFDLIKDENTGISKRQIMEWLKKQEIHQLTTRTRRSNVIQVTTLKQPNKQIGIDLIDMQNLEYKNYRYIITAIDLFSKKAYAEPLENKKAETVIKAMRKILDDIGEKVSSIRSDNGSEFVDSKFRKMLEEKQIKQVFSLPSKPQSNGQIERFNGIIKKMIRMHLLTKGSYDWVSILPTLVDNYNNTKHKTTRMAPNDIKDSKDFPMVAKNIQQAVLKNRDTDKKKFNIGDVVRIKMDKKTSQDFNWSQELYTIHKVNVPKNNISSVSYQLKNKENKIIKDKFYNNDILFIPDIQNPIKMEQKYIISKLVKPVVRNKKIGYIVKWKALRDETFETRQKLLEDVPKMVRAFDKKFSVVWDEKQGKLITWSGEKNIKV